MINVKQFDDTYRITFRYDIDVIAHVKNVPGRRWVPEGKYWEIPRDRLGFLINEFRGTNYESFLKIESEEYIDENRSLDPTVEIPNIDISKIPFNIKSGSKPYQHQLDFMKYAVNRDNLGYLDGFVLCDDQGLGKTVEAYNLAEYHRKRYKFKHCLVICCVNSSKYNWKNDIEDHSDGQQVPYIIGARKKRNGDIRYDTGGKEKLEDLTVLHEYGKKTEEKLPYFLIMNIEALRYKVGRAYAIADRLIELINKGYINMIVVDEIHKNTSMDSYQGKRLHDLAKKSERQVFWLPMTGTPITNTPVDLFLPLKLVGAHTFKSFYAWENEFCVKGGFGGYEIIGYKNIPRLKAMLQANMLRRMKKDVLDLPPKIYYTEYVDNTDRQEKLYENVRQGMLADRESIMKTLNPLAQFIRLRQVNGSPELVDTTIAVNDSYINLNAKLKRLMSLLEEIHERNEKVLIFSNWVEPLRTLYKFVSAKYKTCCFTGTMKPEEREKHKRVFQTNPAYTVLLGTIGAAGTTHTFTAANNIIFYDEPWTPADKEQAEDRAYRIGTTSTVSIYTLITRDTVDDKVHDIIYTKKGISQYIVDNNIDIRNNPRLFDLLLGDTK